MKARKIVIKAITNPPDVTLSSLKSLKNSFIDKNVFYSYDPPIIIQRKGDLTLIRHNDN